MTPKLVNQLLPTRNAIRTPGLCSANVEALRITFIAFYVLQRTLGEEGYSEAVLRQVTGLEVYEIRRACKLLVSKGMVEIGRKKEDKRVRVLRPTELGMKIQDQVLSAAAKRDPAGTLPLYPLGDMNRGFGP